MGMDECHVLEHVPTMLLPAEQNGRPARAARGRK
jgi:hypothetical protein